MATDRGFRNRNPFNLVDSGIKWLGLNGHDGDGFCVFDSDFNGLRAGFKDLVDQQLLHHLDTVAGIIAKFAPRTQNDTAAYIAAVCADVGVAPNQHIDMTVLGNLLPFGRAVVRHENGSCPYDPGLLEQAAQAALDINPPRPAPPAPVPASPPKVIAVATKPTIPTHHALALGGSGSIIIGNVIQFWYTAIQTWSLGAMSQNIATAHAMLLLWGVTAAFALRGKKLPSFPTGSGAGGAPVQGL